MKIGYVLGSFPILSESFILNEICNLIKRGHKIYVFSLNIPSEQIIHPEVIKYNILKNTYYFNLFKVEKTKLLSAYKAVTDFNLLKYKASNPKERVISILAANNFASIASSLNLDVLHAHFNGTPTLTAMFMSKILKIPFTFTSHAYDIFVNPNVLSLKQRINNCKKAITISQFNKKYILKLTELTGKKIVLIRACPFLDEFTKINRSPQEKRILTVSRLVEKKGIIYGLYAIKELINQFPDIDYRIVGSGKMETVLKRAVERLNIKNNVTFLGNLNRSQLLQEYSKAELFLLPCIKAKNGDVDGIPVALMEAMAAEIPVVTSRISGIPELITHGFSGYLTNPKDTASLKEYIRRMLTNRKDSLTMGQNGHSIIENKFNINSHIIKLLQLWKE